MTKVSAHYDLMAENYDSHYDKNQGRIYYGHICSSVSKKLPKGAKLLDLGCGTGLFMQRYLKSGGVAFGIDISRGMIKKAKCRNNSEVFEGTAEVLPFKSETFDCISSILAFSYLQDPAGTLEEIFRVLKPGGAVSICTLGKNVFTAIVPAAYRIGEKLHVNRVGMGSFGEHYYKEHELYDIFFSAGFTDISVERCSFAHVDLKPQIYQITKKFEPFVEEKIPYFAFNICASGIKPKK
nr:class I SAM-dependent methyltransferase [Methanomicrobium sp. W14]